MFFFPVLFFLFFLFFHETNRNLREETNFPISQSPFRSSSKIQSRSLFRSFIHELFHAHNSMLARNKNNKQQRYRRIGKSFPSFPLFFPFYGLFFIFPLSYFFLFFFLSSSFFFRSFVSRGREPTTSPIELSITSERKKRDERIRTSERRSTFVQGDFQLSGISRWNAWKAKSQWSPIDFYEGRKRERERKGEATAEERERKGKRKGSPTRGSSVEFFILTKLSQRAGLERREDKRRRKTCCVRAPRKIISALHTYPR